MDGELDDNEEWFDAISDIQDSTTDNLFDQFGNYRKHFGTMGSNSGGSGVGVFPESGPGSRGNTSKSASSGRMCCSIIVGMTEVSETTKCFL